MITEEQLAELVEFHGHLCPGLAMGVAASTIAPSPTAFSACRRRGEVMATHVAVARRACHRAGAALLHGGTGW